MPKARFIAHGWGHAPGDVVELPETFVACMEQEGVAVRVDDQPKVERAVPPAPAKVETAQIKR